MSFQCAPERSTAHAVHFGRLLIIQNVDDFLTKLKDQEALA
jgi:hypothetical protein